jgi:hypothetical protein
MTAVLVDTNVLLDLFSGDPDWATRSAAAISSSADEATLVINPIIYAELSVGIASIEQLDQFLGEDFRRDPLPWDAAFLAGKAFLQYRRRGGIKTAPLPDFFIGAHAAVRQMPILTRDPKRYASYFPTVCLIEP